MVLATVTTWAHADVVVVLPTGAGGERLVVLRPRRACADLASDAHRLGSDTAPEDLAAWIAHEFRTPLACILGAAELLEGSDGARSDHDERALLDSLVRNGERLAQRVEEAVAYVANIDRRHPSLRRG